MHWVWFVGSIGGVLLVCGIIGAIRGKSDAGYYVLCLAGPILVSSGLYGSVKYSSDLALLVFGIPGGICSFCAGFFVLAYILGETGKHVEQISQAVQDSNWMKDRGERKEIKRLERKLHKKRLQDELNDD